MKYTKNNAMSKKYRHIVDKMNVKYDSTSHSK